MFSEVVFSNRKVPPLHPVVAVLVPGGVCVASTGPPPLAPVTQLALLPATPTSREKLPAESDSWEITAWPARLVLTSRIVIGHTTACVCVCVHAMHAHTCTVFIHTGLVVPHRLSRYRGWPWVWSCTDGS